jgi:hypothetical protein
MVLGKLGSGCVGFDLRSGLPRTDQSLLQSTGGLRGVGIHWVFSEVEPAGRRQAGSGITSPVLMASAITCATPSSRFSASNSRA